MISGKPRCNEQTGDGDVEEDHSHGVVDGLVR